MQIAALNFPVITVFSIYIFTILSIGFMAGKVTKNLSDYILAGRNLSGVLTAMGAGASDMSGWLMMALPGAVFLNGINYIWIPIGLSIGAFCNWQFVAKRLRVYTEVANDSLTVPAYLQNRFLDRSRLLRIVTASVVLIFFTVYAAAGFVSGGMLLQSVFQIPYLPALLISASIIIIYTCIGGFLAISWLDLFQGSLMFLALLIVPAMTIFHLNGVSDTFNLLASQGKQYFNAFHDVGIISILSFLAWGLGYFGQTHIIVRFMAAKTSKDIPMAQFICMTWMILALYGAVMTGFVGLAYTHKMGQSLANPETIFLVLSQVLFSPWIAGFLLAAVLSAVMNTVSAQLLASASALTEDLYRDIFRPQANNREMMIVVRLAVLVIALIALTIAATSSGDGLILKLVAYAWGGMGAAFGPTILISLYWRNMTRIAAIVGICTGAATVIIWEILGHKYGGIFKLYSLLPAFGLGTISIFLTGFVCKPSQQVVAQFDVALKQLKVQTKQAV